VAREQLPGLLGVATLRRRREADEVGEEHAHEPPFGGRLRDCRRGGRKRRAALAAELVVRGIRGPTRRAHARERRPALPAELAARGVRGAASGTRHAATPAWLSARSSHGVAPSRANVSRASASSGSASAVLPSAISASACSSCVTASQKGKPYSRKPPAAV